jgi:hypothetical protein
MSGFLYFLKGVNIVNSSVIDKFGLSYAISPLDEFTQRQAAGPDGDGMLLCLGNNAERLFFKPDEQVWAKCGNYYVGHYKNELPVESALRRKRQLAGHYVELADGERWLIPIARIISGGSALPQSLILGDNGEILTGEMPQYAGFSAKAQKLWQDFRIENKWDEGTPQLTAKDRMELAIDALAWNYRIGRIEVNMLHLLTTQNLAELMAVIIDVPTLMEMAQRLESDKKKDVPVSAGSNIKGGAAD